MGLKYRTSILKTANRWMLSPANSQDSRSNIPYRESHIGNLISGISYLHY
jgi:hypothetical protein